MNHKMFENELISIIIPIYNVENYLRQCLDSIIAQTYQNFECLLINDGSPDNSADICNEYVSKDSRFRYFEKENGGVSSARNLGIERSEGAYITFIDSDDWVDSDYLEVLYNALIDENADISVSTYKRFEMGDNCWYVHAFQRGYDKKVFTNKKLMDELLFLDGFDNSYRFVCGKLVRKYLLDNIAFNEMTTLGEDMEFWFKIYTVSDRVVYVNKETYNYRTDERISKHFTLDAVRSEIQQRLNFIALLSSRGIDTKGYVDECLKKLHEKKKWLKNVELDSTETMRWINETIYLLQGTN